jgi:hypothetical protein
MPYDKHREPPKESVGVFDQHVDHKLILLSASIGEPGLDSRAFLRLKHPAAGTRFSNSDEKEARL